MKLDSPGTEAGLVSASAVSGSSLGSGVETVAGATDAGLSGRCRGSGVLMMAGGIESGLSSLTS